MDRKADKVVPIHLTPVVASGYAPALSIYKDTGTPSIQLGAGEIAIDGQAFTYTGEKSLALLAAEVARAMPSIEIRALSDVAPEASSLALYPNDLTPDGGTVVRYKGLTAATTERTRIRLLRPHNDGHQSAWWPRINRGTIRTNYAGATFTFSIPEYHNQTWSPTYGAPWKEFGGVGVQVIDQRILQLPRGPIMWPGPLTIRRNGKALQQSIIEDVYVETGKVYLNTPVALTDRITADFVYKEEDYVYKGINLNPTLQHSPYLVDRFVVFYLVPWRSNTGLKNSTCVRHTVGDTLEGAISELARGVSEQTPIVLLGAVRTRQVEDAKDVTVYDARRPGGGVKKEVDAVKRESEAWFYADIGNYDGRPYPGNAVVIVRLPENVKTLFSEDEVQETVRRHTALGTLPIVDYE